MSVAASEITWISHVLKELRVTMLTTLLLYCDNLSAVYLTANPAYHNRSKHFETYLYYVRQIVALSLLEVKHISSHLQIAYIFTKSLPAAAFECLRFKLDVDVPPTPSLRGANNKIFPASEGVKKKQVQVVKTEV